MGTNTNHNHHFRLYRTRIVLRIGRLLLFFRLGVGNLVGQLGQSLQHFFSTVDDPDWLTTPLAALQAQLQVALRARDDDERERSLTQLQHGLTRASHLVDQMLQLARLDPESSLPDTQQVDLAILAEEICAELGTAILDKNLDFDLQATPGCTITGQPDWLCVLMRNLVDNAIRYTPPGGKIVVSLSEEQNSYRFTVSDNGLGIPAEERDAVLRRFHRLNHQEQPGSGLGLSIVTRIAELHGAHLELGDGEAARGLSISVIFRKA